jgi:hypothetical protein
MKSLRLDSFIKKRGWPGMVVHICNPSYSEGRDKRITGWPKQKCRPYLKNNQKRQKGLGV